MLSKGGGGAGVESRADAEAEGAVDAGVGGAIDAGVEGDDIVDIDCARDRVEGMQVEGGGPDPRRRNDGLSKGGGGAGVESRTDAEAEGTVDAGVQGDDVVDIDCARGRVDGVQVKGGGVGMCDPCTLSDSSTRFAPSPKEISTLRFSRPFVRASVVASALMRNGAVGVEYRLPHECFG